jgi:hypothetical protein
MLHNPTDPFHGTFVLQSWHNDLTGRQCKGYTGTCTLIPSSAIVPGEDLVGKDANWMVGVSGEHQTFYVPGCQIHAVVRHDETYGPNDLDYYRVQ